MKRIGILLAVLLAIVAFPAAAQSGLGYSEGNVTQIAAIKVNAGHMDQYLEYLRSDWKKEQEALKEAGIIVGYAVYSTTARNPKDPDLYLATTYANMAALDNLDARSDPVTAKAMGTDRKAGQKGMADRNAYREVLGVELIRELKFD